MPDVAFVAPILPGKTEAWRAAMAELSGPRQAEYHESRERLGIRREARWLQRTGEGDFAIIYLEADDLGAAFRGLGFSEEPFDQWFRATMQDVHGFDLRGQRSPEQHVDYRRADAGRPATS